MTFCDKDYRCLCSYLLDDATNKQIIKLLEQLPDLCPLCKNCSRRDEEIRLQKKVKLLLQNLKDCYRLLDTVKEKIIRELEDINLYRETGIEVLDLVKCHSHIALIYKDHADRLEIARSFITNGLKKNELCLWITSTVPIDDVTTDFKKDNDVSNLKIVPFEELLSSLDNGAKSKLIEFHILPERYSSIRLVSEMPESKDDIHSCITRYESFAQDLTLNHPAITLCMYHNSLCDRPEVMSIIDIHDHIIHRLEDGWKVETRKRN